MSVTPTCFFLNPSFQSAWGAHELADTRQVSMLTFATLDLEALLVFLGAGVTFLPAFLEGAYALVVNPCSNKHDEAGPYHVDVLPMCGLIFAGEVPDITRVLRREWTSVAAQVDHLAVARSTSQFPHSMITQQDIPTGAQKAIVVVNGINETERTMIHVSCRCQQNFNRFCQGRKCRS
jgi:hypothetical protein